MPGIDKNYEKREWLDTRWKRGLASGFFVVLLFFVISYHLLYIDDQFNWSRKTSAAEEFKKLHKSYLVNTQSCKIADWPVLDDETVEIFENYTDRPYKCPKTAVTIKRINGIGIHIATNDKDANDSINCEAQIGKFKGDAEKWKFSRDTLPVPLNKLFYFENDTDSVNVLCYRTVSNETKLIHEEVMPLVRYLSDGGLDGGLDGVSGESNKSVESAPSVPNVLLLGLDSVSALQFERHFTHTKQLLRRRQFVRLFGYNKVGLNTYPNMFPFLSGLKPNPKYSEKGNNDYFDDEPLIWKDYAKLGFKTLLMEDWPPFTIFNYLKNGFSKRPTDYYPRPSLYAIYDKLTKKDYCYNGRIEYDTYYDYVYDFADEMTKREKNYFAFVFLARVTHDYAQQVAWCDKPVYNLLTRLFGHGLLKNTVVALFSDHGLRYGSLRRSQSGELEARLPMMHIYLPPTLDSKYRQQLVANQHLLTTPFDIHATLKHIAMGHSVSEPFGYSLFTHIPTERTCQNASIEMHFCACSEDEEATDLSATEVATMSQSVIDKVNSILTPRLDICHKLTLNNTRKIHYRYLINEDTDSKDTKIKVLLLQVSALPSGAVFEALLRPAKPYPVIGTVARLDEYGNQSACVHDMTLERYCFCRNYRNASWQAHAIADQGHHQNILIIGGIGLMLIIVIIIYVIQRTTQTTEYNHYQRLNNIF